MNVTREKLNSAVENNIITAEQAVKLHAYLSHLPDTSPAFTLTNVLYYMGGLVAIGAMTLFMNLGWEALGGWGIVLIALAYAVAGLLLTGHFQRKGYAIPAGLCAVFVVALTPLAIYGLQHALGLWPDETVYREFHRQIKWHWLMMEFGTLAVGVIMAWRFKYPFLIMPIAFTLWYMSVDVASMLTGDTFDYTFQAQVSLCIGLLMGMVAIWVDFRSEGRPDYAFWLYIFAVMAFWGGLTVQESGSELGRFIYCCINLLMIFTGVILVRRVFVIFGAIGVSLYLGHLAQEVFEDSWLFPITLTALGLLIIYLGVVWQKHETTLTVKVRQILPAKFRTLLENKA